MKRLNLLPKSKQKELSRERLFFALTVAGCIAVLVLLVGFVAQIAVSIYLNDTSSRVETEIEEVKKTANKTENAAVKQKILAANAQIEDFAQLSDKSPQWSEVLKAFIKHVPSGIKVTSFSANADTKEVTIVGFSPTRDAVIDLYNNINSDKEHFKGINYPLENVAQPTNVTFTFTFTIVDTVLIKESK